MARAFDAQLQKGDNPGAWTCVVMDDVPELFATRGLVKIRGTIDGEAFVGALMPQGDGTHRLPVRAALRKAIGKEAGQTVHDDRPEYRRGFLTALSDRVRNEARVPTIVGGYLTTLDEANTIVAAGRADLVLLDLPETEIERPLRPTRLRGEVPA